MIVNVFLFHLELSHITPAVDIYSLGMVTLEVKKTKKEIFDILLLIYLDD